MDLGQYLLIAFEFWSAVFCIITALCVFLTRKYDHRSAVYLMGMLTVNAVLNAADALAYYYRGDGSQLGYWMVRITNFSVFLCNDVLLLYVVCYICRVIERNSGTNYRKLQRIAEGFIITGIVLLVLSRFFGFYYTFDEMNQYHRLDSFPLLVLLTEIPLIIIAGIIHHNWDSLKKSERNSFLLFIIVPITGIILQIFLYGVSVTTIANNISILTVFISYEMGYADYMVTKEKKLLEQMTMAFAHAIDEKDSYTGGHSERVAAYSMLIADRMGMKHSMARKIYQMALLHDIGKIGIDDAILRKPSRLTDEEFEAIKKHTLKGSEILGEITEMPELTTGARWHHERYDGKGYPDGLKGDEIPIEARIICVADSYDAMTSDRSYRKNLSQEKVRSEIAANIGIQFDPLAAKCMLDIIDDDRDFSLQEN